jgi:hypothetical protein
MRRTAIADKEDSVMPRNLRIAHASRLQAAIVIASLFISFQADATTLLKKDFDALVAEAEAIVVGTVSDVQSRYEADNDIHTLVTLTDLRVLHGSYQESSLTLQVAGGQIKNDVMRVDGSPTFAVKDRVLLFIRGNGQQMVPFVGWTQGVFRFEHDAKTGKQTVKDHDRNPVLEVRGSDVIKNEIFAPEATIVERAQGSAGNSDTPGKIGAPSAGSPQAARSAQEPLEADAFIRAVVRKTQEKRALGRAIHSVDAALPPGVLRKQDAAPPIR